jgi:hypothetical protein
MQRDFPESDWKAFRELRELALERFCTRVLDEVPRFIRNTEHGSHERYVELFRWMGERNDDLARAFDDPRRSNMLWKLAELHAQGLLRSDEFARFTPQTRARVESLSQARGWRAAQQGDEADKP